MHKEQHPQVEMSKNIPGNGIKRRKKLTNELSDSKFQNGGYVFLLLCNGQ